MTAVHDHSTAHYTCAMATTTLPLATLRSSGLETVDPDVAGLIGQELERQQCELELIASENFTWPAVLEAVGSVGTNKYAEGYPGRRYYGGCRVVDELERLAITRAEDVFGADHANVQPHAGAQANMGAYLAVLDVGDTVMGLRLDQGGHLTHGHPVNFSGKQYHFVSYGVRPDDERIDMDEVRRLAVAHRPKLIVAGASAYARHFDFAAFRQIADEVGALFMVDMAHVAGLVAAGVHPSPVPYADIVTSTTHKTLAGPRGGFILCRAPLAKRIDSAVFPGMQGGPLMHTIAAKAVCFAVAKSDAFGDYQQRVVANADALAERLTARGHRLVSGGTDNHLVLLNLKDSVWDGKQAEDRLAACRITVNRNAVPFDPRPPMVTSGVRIGTPAATMRGLDEADFREVADVIADALAEDADLDALGERIGAMLARRPLYSGLRGYGQIA
jgi:glycine hydroxymethyltransferase